MVEATSTWTGSRRLLRRLRDIMAGPGSAQTRLDHIVTLIASDMVAEVCSVYIARAGQVLELFATEGLRPDAVHRTRLYIGEGLVGHIAATGRALSLADARSHPLFAFRPETGEEIYASLMGVPVVRGGRVLGVLAVQNRTQRSYTDEEIELLQTVAMVLAELLASGELVALEELRARATPGQGSTRMEGVSLSVGMAGGPAVLHTPAVTIANTVAEDVAAELRRLEAATAALQDRLAQLARHPGLADEGDPRDIFETFQMLARDQGWRERMAAAVSTGLTAEAAAQKVHYATRARMAESDNIYLRERMLDVEDLTNRLLRELQGNARSRDWPPNAVLFARSLGTADLLEAHRAGVSAVVLEEGSASAHAAIVARTLGLPAVGRVAGILSHVEDGDPVLIDAEDGLVYIRPGEQVRSAFARSQQRLTARQRVFETDSALPAVTRDGETVVLNLNAALPADVGRLATTGAAGVGLYRTEVPFMVPGTRPDVETQTRIYSHIMREAAGKPVVFRTLDIGGDKMISQIVDIQEDNPAMGWRALRVALDRPAIMREQLRSLIAATRGADLHIMFPMVATVAEFVAARALLDRALDRTPVADRPASIRVGAMVEVPSLLWQLPALLPRVDFLSVGSNDLVQFLYASDRANPRLESRYDPLSPTVLRVFGELARACAAADVPVTVCGEMAGRPLQAMVLVGLGFRSLSMAPPSIGPVKAMIRSLDARLLGGYLTQLETSPAANLRARLRAYAKDHGVDF